MRLFTTASPALNIFYFAQYFLGGKEQTNVVMYQQSPGGWGLVREAVEDMNAGPNPDMG